MFLRGILAEEMGGDEILFFIVAGALAIAGLVIWYSRLAGSTLLGRRPPLLALLSITPPICFAILYFILIKWSDPDDVATDWRYIGLFLAGGGAFLTGFMLVMPLLGPHFKIDVLNQHNPAAALAAVGGMIGVILAYSFSNIGDGPTIWTTIGPAILATLSLLALWFFLELFSGISEVITIDRDAAAGLRLAGFLIAAGLILGRAMAGDYVSAGDTTADFIKQGWIALPLCIAAAVVERFFKPTPRMPKPPIVAYGLVPALIYILFAAAWVFYLGKW